MEVDPNQETLDFIRKMLSELPNNTQRAQQLAQNNMLRISEQANPTPEMGAIPEIPAAVFSTAGTDTAWGKMAQKSLTDTVKSTIASKTGAANGVHTATTGKPADFIKAFTPYATTASQLTGIPSELILAQWANETGFGTSYGVRNRNNLAGIGGRSGYKSYASVDQFVQDYADLINRKYPQIAKAAQTGGIPAAASAWGKSGWAEHGYRLGASGDEYKGSSGTTGTEGQALLAILKQLGY